MNRKTLTLGVLLGIYLLFLTVFIPLVSALEDSWTVLAEMQTARSGFGVAVVDGKIYAIGGYNGSYLAVNEMYDPVADAWLTKAPMSTPRADFGVAVVQSKIYVFGGITGPSDYTLPSYTEVTEVYDPEADTWENLTSMPTPRYSLTANVINDRVYLIGGFDPTKMMSFESNVNEVYEPETNTWTTKASIPQGVWNYASAILDNRLYIIGGLVSQPYGPLGSTGTINLNQIYDAETDEWSSGAIMPSYQVNLVAGATTGELAPEKIYVYGTDFVVSPDVPTYFTQVYIPENDTWTDEAPFAPSRSGFSVAVVNDELYAIGGSNNETYSNTNEKYTPIGYIPEFSSWILLMIMIIAVMLIIVKYKLRLFKSN
jgi:N-acetylneuraminic acid mutarotase